MSETWRPRHSHLAAGTGGLTLDDVTADTQAVISRLKYDHASAVPLVMPIHNSATYKIASVQNYLDILNEGGYIYSRLGNPSCESVESVVCDLERGAGSMTFSSGMAAVTTAILATCKQGDHVVAQNPIYSGTHRFLTKHAMDYGIEYSWVPAGASAHAYEAKVKSNTKLLIGETPCNPLISVLDLEEFGKLGQRLGITTMVDATYASPYLLQPIKFGIDIVVHSATKYLGGHSDLTAGVLTTQTEDMWAKLNILRTTLGNVLSPFDASLLSRGLKTLPVRMQRHCDNAEKIANYLASHRQVDRVYYPGLATHPGHQVAKTQMKRFGGMVSFEVKGGLEPTRTLVESVRVIQLAVSLGAAESLIEHPATMTHGPMVMNDDERKESLITDGLVRFSVGLEDAEDLIRDLDQAFAKASQCHNSLG